MSDEVREWDIPVVFQATGTEKEAALKVAAALGQAALLDVGSIESWHMPNHQFADGSDNPVRVVIEPIEPAYSERRGLVKEIEAIIESYNGPHPKRTANAEQTIEAAMRYPIEWQGGFDDGYGELSTGVTYDDDPDGDRSRAYDLGRNAGDLERLRAVIRTESISQGEIAELQGLEPFIDPSDAELLEWAGVPEFEDSDDWVAVSIPRIIEVADKYLDSPFWLVYLPTMRVFGGYKTRRGVDAAVARWNSHRASYQSPDTVAVENPNE